MGRLLLSVVLFAPLDAMLWLAWILLWGPTAFRKLGEPAAGALLLAILLMAVCFSLSVIDLARTKGRKPIVSRSTSSSTISVAIPAFNEEENIEYVVKDFSSSPAVTEVVVVDNNSTDATAEIARRAGARVVPEPRQGYGYACLTGLKSAQGDVVVLAEADKTQSSKDMPKFLAYLDNADMVVGTRTTLELVEPGAKMDPFLKIGNTFLAKLIQMRFWGKVRLTDVGCTYRAIWRSELEKIAGKLTVGGSHFSPEMIIKALENELTVIEIPVTYRQRGGFSKITGASRRKSFIVGLRMLRLILAS